MSIDDLEEMLRKAKEEEEKPPEPKPEPEPKPPPPPPPPPEPKEAVKPDPYSINVLDLPDYTGFLKYVKEHPTVLEGLCLEDRPTKRNPTPTQFDKVARVWNRIVDDTIKVYKKMLLDMIRKKEEE